MKAKTSFEWQTDKEEDGEALPPPAVLRPHRRRNRLLWSVSILLILCVAALVSYLQVSRRVSRATQRTETELLSSHLLLYQAVLESDGELFTSLLSDEDARWYKLQQALLAQQLFLDRAPLGFWLSESAVAESAARDRQVELSPDMSQAVVREDLPYLIESRRGVTGTVLLERTSTYRLLDERWRLAPPPDETAFWGKWTWQEGDFLKLFYPARDGEAGRWLFPELEQIIRQLCLETDIFCPTTFQLQLRLSRDPDSLLQLQEIRRGLSPGSFHMDLPAPTWVGTPVDEAGYQALLHGYAGWLATALVNSFAAAELIDNQTLDRYLAPLGLRPPAQPRATPLQADRPPPIPWPDQEVLLLCDSFLPPRLMRYSPGADLWLDPAEQGATPGFTSVLRNSNPLLLPLPDDSGILAQVHQAVEGAVLWRTYALLDGRERLLVQSDFQYTLLPLIWQSQSDPARLRLIFYGEVTDASQEIRFYWVDLQSCPDSPCQLQPAEGAPLWSFDQQRALLLQMSADGRSMLFLGDGQARIQEQIGAGFSPLWLDDSRFVYIRPNQLEDNGYFNPHGGFALVQVDLSDEAAASEAAAVWLDSNALLSALPAQDRPALLWMRLVSGRGSPPETLLLWVTSAEPLGDGSDYVFEYDMASGQISILAALGEARLIGPWGLEDNPRYLTMITYQSGSWSLWALDMTRGQLNSIASQRPSQPVFDWAAGGEWLALAEDGLLKLIAPAHAYEKTAYHNLSGCGSVAWVNK